MDEKQEIKTEKKSDHQRGEFGRNLLCTLLAFLLCILLCGTGILLLPGLTVFRSDFYINALEKSKFAQGLSDDIGQEYVSLCIPGGIPEEVALQALDQEALQFDLYSYVMKTLEGEEYSLDKAAIRDNIYAIFLDYAQSQTSSLTEQEEKDLQTLAGYCADQYIQKVTLPGMGYIYDIHIKTGTYLKIGIIISLFAFALLSLLLFGARKTKYRALRFYISTFMGAAFILGIPALLLAILRPQDRLSLWPVYFYDFTVSCVDNILLHLLVIAGILLFVALNLIGLYFLLLGHRPRKRNRT